MKMKKKMKRLKEKAIFFLAFERGQQRERKNETLRAVV